MAKKLKQGIYINLEVWNGEGDGSKVQKRGDICIPKADSDWSLKTAKFCKRIILQLSLKK